MALGIKKRVQNERDHLSEGTIIGLQRMKEYARSKGGAGNVVISERMVKHIIEAGKLDEERLRKEREAKEELKKAQKKKEDEENEEKKLLEKAQRSKRRVVEKEISVMKEGEKLGDDLEIVQRTLTTASANLQKAIADNDAVGIKVASEMIAVSQRKLEEANKLKKKVLKDQAEIGRKRKNTIENLFAKM